MRSVLLILPGLFLQAVSLLAFSSCSKPQMPATAATDSPSNSFLALGDSYTIGESVGSLDRFPAQTAGMLKMTVYTPLQNNTGYGPSNWLWLYRLY